MKYTEFLPPCFVVETAYGAYPIGAWIFCTQRHELSLAIAFCQQQRLADAYRVVDLEGKVLYPEQASPAGDALAPNQ